ncbi:MAG TPA: hypothetical protein DEB06_08650 [Phycisphaerales bacterium]|nr:hypothetical protein [Phycisphaerales bacterium]
MIPLVSAVFIASLLGSLHCVGMCGAFLAFAVGVDAPIERRRRARLQSAYHTGRLITYTALGAVAGAAGAAFDAAGTLIGLQRVALVGAGAAMVLFGTLAVLRINGVRLPHPPAPRAMHAALQRVFRAASQQPPIVRALVTGLATTLLPCGWLYAFVITAAGTAHPGLGALTMGVFWLGTLPVLVALGTGLQHAGARLGALGRRVPLITALAVIGVGLSTVFSRADPSASLPRALAASVPARHEVIDRVHHISDSPPPCCADDDH